MPGGFRMLLQLVLVTRLGWTVADVRADDTVCSLQKSSPLQANSFSSLNLDGATLPERPGAFGPSSSFDGFIPSDLWSTPGLTFRHCAAPRPASAPHGLLQQEQYPRRRRPAWTALSPKPKCVGPQVPIGRFVQGSYTFTCCAAGEQCGGCRLEQGGSCMQCAAGYVMQTIPILNTSKCFVCDDVPNWHDKEGRSCADLESLGICSGTWPNKDQDVAFHGIRPSEACCACGGGSIYPTPVYMPLQFQSLYVGQNINQTPQPVTAGVQQVAPGCELASSGLELSNDGRVLGVVTLQNQSVIKCSTVSVQDPVRGLVSNIDFSLPVSAFSYGDQIVHFKFWGLDASPPQQIIAPHTTLPAAISGARLHCDPHCPWLSVTTAGVLHWNPSVPTTSAQPVPAELSSQVTTLSGMPSCSCQVLALFQGTPSSSSLFLAAQSRLWKGAVWEWSFLLARVGAELAPVRLLEDLGSGFRWYNRSGHVLEVQVAENIATGEKMVLPQSVPPTILDVDCVDDAGNTLTWSRINGDVRRQSQVAFKLDPATGTVSGTPLLGLSSTQGRAEVNVTCQVALGGPLYDMELPVAVLQVHILDDVCWVPRNISGSFRWQKVTASGEGLCLQQCRLREDCAAIIFSAGTCELMVSDGNESFVPEALALVRLNNCSEQDASLNLTVPDAQYLQGEFSVMNVYHDTASYSRPGSNPKRQLLLSRTENVQQIPTSCAKSSWMLLHINSSDFEDAQSKNAPEFFGDPMACIDSDVVGNTFQQGQVAFDLHLLPAELQAKPTKLRTAALQPATLALSAPSCPKPTLPNLMLGSVQDSSLYSLHPCDCFGAAHAHVAPVDAASNAAVPRNAQGHFNNGSVSDRRLFSGPYTCEETASVGQFPHLDMEACQKACASEPKCQFYLFGKTSQTCTLFQSCNYIQDVGLQVVNELYGIPPPNANYCRIANPQQCWQEIRRRSMLSFTPSDLPMCLFQEQADACDALQLLLGKQDGPCTRCEYIDATSPFAATGLQKTPPPESFSSASQISVACNDTSTMFSRLQAGLQWEGPRQNPVTFTCVSGEWVGELGIWQDMSNFTCERCLQVGSGTLQRLSLVSMPEIYFLEHRQVHLNYPFSIHGCSRAGFLTASPLLSTGMGMFLGVAKDQSLKLFSAATGASWWIDAYSDQLRVKDGSLDPRKNWCVCYDKMPLYACACSSSHMLLMQGGLLQGGQQCASANATGALDFTACPQSQLRSNVEFLWHFESGDCFFGFDLQNTAEKLWTATSEASGISGPPLRLGNFAFKSSSSQQGLFQIYLDYPPFNARLCLHADLTKKNGGGYPMVISSDCASAFMWRGAHLAYFHQGDFTTTYYLEMNVDALIVTRTTNPGAQFNFKISKGAISPSTQPNMCLQAQWNDVATTHNGARSQVAGINIPPYTPCSSYGEFSGINEVNGTYEQVCRASPLLFYQDTKPAQCMTLSAANQQFPHLNLAEGLPGTPSPDALIVFCADFGYVLSNVTWPAEIPPYNHTGNGVQQQCSAFCSYIGSKYTSVSQAHHFPNNAEPATLDPTTHLMNFSCPETKLLRGVVYNMFAAICEGPWLTEIKEDPSSETPVFFNDRAVQAVPICAAEFKRMVICREGRLSKGLCFTNATS
ncbi:unnamed protein product [Durusdinium trenchii]|uniref:Uncharacterized protein n=1 Tax=Durusdinium trenchii TaxID=1381693 RepID=A0ABP0RA56_9DINO